jgi:hypothetical protein
MASQIYNQIKSGFSKLNPGEVREAAGRRLSIGLIASTSAGFAALEDLFAPPSPAQAGRCAIERVRGAPTSTFDLLLAEGELLVPPGAFRFDPADPRRTVREIVDRREDLQLALASNFRAFRQPVIAKIVKAISRENALFSVLTALPDILPSIVELPWAVGEFASDTAFLTMNQVRMAFLIAGASDRDVGYREQRAQIAGIVGGAFGWRALARELAGKIPFGGGLLPKAAIAYAGTYTVGIGLERFYRVGYGLTREERRRIYTKALERGRVVVDAVLKAARIPGRAAVRPGAIAPAGRVETLPAPPSSDEPRH